MLLRRKILIVLLVLGGLSCSSSNLENVVKSSVKDGIVSADEWKMILEIAQVNTEFCKEDGQVDIDCLKEYILSVAHTKMRGIDNVAFPFASAGTLGNMTIQSDEPIKMKFFLERSGSMIPYDSPRTKGNFKAGISRLLNSIPTRGGDKNILYVVNNSVYPYRQTYRKFLQSKDIFKDTRNMGDPRYTDFTCIFDSILSNTRRNELSILASDLIYSTKDMETVNPQKIRNEAQAMTTNIFKEHAEKDVLVIKLMADFEGNYYPYKSPNKGIYYEGNRPYYLMMVGESDVIRRIFFDKEYSEFSDFEHLKGFENYYCFSHHSPNPYYSVLLSDKRNKGRFGAVKGSGTTIHSIEDVTPDRNGKVAITIAIDLSPIIADEKFKGNKDNYEISSIANYEIEEIDEIGLEDRTSTMERYAPNATHLIVLSTEAAVKNEVLTLKLKNRLPQWVAETNSDDDTNLSDSNFAKTTFAFEYLMQGIYDSFYSSTEESYLFSINLTINK